MLIIELIHNLGFLIALSVLSSFLDKKFPRITIQGKILQGILFGIVAVFGMLNPFVLAPGLIFDGRTIILSLATFFFGGIPGIIAGILSLIYRINLGGPGIYMGIATIISPVIVGYLFHIYYKKYDKIIKYTDLYILGLIVHFFYFIFIFLLPNNFAKQVLGTVSITVILFYPIATVLIGQVLLMQEQNFKFIHLFKNQRDNLATTLNSIGDAVITTDYEGKVMLMNPIAEKLTGWKTEDAVGRSLTEVFHIINAITRQTVENPVKKVLSTGKVVGLANHTVLISKDGKEYHIADSAAPIVDQTTKSFNGIVMVFSDVTDKYILQKKLEESEFIFRRLYEASADPILLLDDSGFFDCNEATLKLLGYSNKSELIGKQPWEISPEFQPDGSNSLEKAFLMIRKALNEGYNKFEWTHLTKDENEIFVEVMLTPILLNGKQTFYTVWRDITEKKLSEKNLIASELKFRNLFEKHSAIELIVDPENLTFVDVNFAAEKFYGYSREQFIGESVTLINKAPLEKISNMINLILSEQKLDFEVAHIISNGEERDVRAFASIVEINNKKYIHLIIVDITKLKLSERNLKLLYKAIEQNPTSVVITNSEGEIEYVNPKFSEVSGYRFEEIYGKNPRILKSGIHTQEFYKNLWDTIKSGETWTGEICNKRKDGSLYWENDLISPIVNDFNEITNFIKISEDITEKKRIYEEIIQAKQKAEESERLKTAFLQNMSHEIRTPLNGVIGFSNLLSTKDLSKSDISEYSSIIQTSAKRLLEIVNNILDISKIETGQIKIVQGEFSINTLIRNIYSIFSLIAKEKELEFNYSVALDDISSVIYSDETKIHQILSNLVNNALKFTKTGSVNFGYNVEDENLIFYVKDTGIGIPEDMQTKIFERFIQADMGLTRNFEGAGLGLAICNGLANLLGGKIWLESEIGKGSTFYFSIPFNQIKNQSNLYSEKEEKIEMLTNKKILIVEDDFTSYLYLRILLDDIGVPTLYASDGTEALEIIKNNNDIALILMDIRMPKMNGIDATKEIKSTYPDLPIIAQTAYAYSEEKEKVLALGCDDYLSKPIDKNLLYKTIKKYIN